MVEQRGDNSNGGMERREHTSSPYTARRWISGWSSASKHPARRERAGGGRGPESQRMSSHKKGG